MRRGKVAFPPVLDPSLGMFRSLKGVVTVSAVYHPKKDTQASCAWASLQVLFGWSRLLYTSSSGVWIFRGALKGSQVLPALVSCFDWALAAQLGRYSRVVAAHTRMGADLLLGRKPRELGVSSGFVEGSRTLDGALVR